MMKILVLSTMYPNSKVFLSGIFVHEQVKALKNEGVEITVIAPIPYTPKILAFVKDKWKSYRQIPSQEEIEGIIVHHPRYISLPKGLLKNIWSYPYIYFLKRYLKMKKISISFDIIHAHGSLPNDHAAYLLYKEFGIPYVVTVHGDTVYALIKYPSRFKASREALLNAKAIIVVSSQVSKRVEKQICKKEKIFTILNGFNPINSDIQNSEPAGNELMILFVATLIERKGCEYLLRAFSHIHKKYKNVRLVIGGGGELFNKMKRLSKILGVSDRVSYTGTLNHDKAMELMMKCDIFVLPSWDEAFGVVYLEAMSFKKPIVATEGEGISDVVRDGVEGFLVKPRDVDSIAKKLSLLIENKELRKEIGTRGYQKIKSLTWQNNALKTIEVYKKCMVVKY